MTVAGRSGIILAVVLPLLCAALLAAWAGPLVSTQSNQQWLKPLHLASVQDAETVFNQLDYPWPLDGSDGVPRIFVQTLPSDLDNKLSIQRKKALFLRLLLPLVIAENQAIRQQRAWLESVLAAELPDKMSQAGQYLQQLADTYRVRGSLHNAEVQQRLLRRIDEIPAALVLAQAATESGWGTSRFAQQGNNLFGHWTFRTDQGLIPKQRDAGRNHRVRIFSSLRGSLRAYFHNLNTTRPYQSFRNLRAQLRQQGSELDGFHLADGLMLYSERGADYVAEIRRLIKDNSLADFDHLELRPGIPRLGLMQE